MTAWTMVKRMHKQLRDKQMALGMDRDIIATRVGLSLSTVERVLGPNYRTMATVRFASVEKIAEVLGIQIGFHESLMARLV